MKTILKFQSIKVFFLKTDEEKANLNGYIPAAKPIIHHHLNGTEGAAEHRTISAISSQELRALPTVKKSN